jgi:Zn-dependent M28 family amino/carboxypeptidase
LRKKTTQTKKIFNGADDNASGVSAIINLANHFTKLGNNERTLMFAAFSAEEIGGFGSRYFSNQIDANSITAMINIEMIGKPAVFGEGSVWMTGMERSNLGVQLNEVLAPKQLTIYADPYPNQNLFYRSDNATLARLGVPAHSFSSTQLDKDQHYHQVSDDIDSLNLPSMLKVIKMLAIATTPLVEGTVTPMRIDANNVSRKGLIY